VRPDRRGFLRALPFLVGALARPASARAMQPGSVPFVVGWNVPWFAYGHDHGANAWGHDGFSTNGWTRETYVDSQGFVDTAIVRGAGCSGRGVLRITADMLGQHPNRGSGEVHLHLGDRTPGLCPTAGVPPYLDLPGVPVRVRLTLPPGSAGAASQPNGIQLVFKTRVSDTQWPSLYTAWQNIQPGWEGRCVDLVGRVSASEAALVEPGFDARRVTLAGLKCGIGGQSAAALRGAIDLESFTFETSPPVTFAFDDYDIAHHFRSIRDLSGSLRVARVFVFADGRAAPEFGPDGSVTGFDDRFARDFDVLVDSAARAGVQLIPVLFDFSICERARQVSGVQLGGRSNVIRNPVSVASALTALFQRYGSHPAIHSWEIINEPEWVLRENPERMSVAEVDHVTVDEMRAFVALCATLVHRYTIHPVTVGAARQKWLSWWAGLGLDHYHFHWYDHHAADDPFPWRPAASLGLDRPCYVGEVPIQSTRHTPAEYLASAQAGGYAGLLFWSCRGRDAFSGL
jgi:hypothetical protein